MFNIQSGQYRAIWRLDVDNSIAYRACRLLPLHKKAQQELNNKFILLLSSYSIKNVLAMLFTKPY